jgi:hypothetical protein
MWVEYRESNDYGNKRLTNLTTSFVAAAFGTVHHVILVLKERRKLKIRHSLRR